MSKATVWFTRTPTSHRRFGGHKATARAVSEKESEEILFRSAGAHPKTMKGVARMSGYELDGDDLDIIEFSNSIMIVKFKIDIR